MQRFLLILFLSFCSFFTFTALAEAPVLTVPFYSCNLPAPDGIYVEYVTPTSAKINWNPVAGATGYRTRLHDLTNNTVYEHDNATTSRIYDGTQIIPGHTYTFQVASYCASGTYGDFSEAKTFTAPIIVVIDIVARECTPNLPSTIGTYLLPITGATQPGAPLSMDLTWNNNGKIHVYSFNLRSNPQGGIDATFMANDGEFNFSRDCEVAPVCSANNCCSTINIYGQTGTGQILLATLEPQSEGQLLERFIHVSFLANNATLSRCINSGRGLIAPAADPNDVAATEAPVVPSDNSEAAQTASAGTRGKEVLESVQTLPNPFTRDIELRFTLPQSGSVQVTISDMTGRQVYSQNLGDALAPGQYAQRLPVENLNSGIYILTLYTDNGMLSRRIIKQ